MVYAEVFSGESPWSFSGEVGFATIDHFFCYKSPARSPANSSARSSVFSYFMFFCYMQQKSRLFFATVAKSGFRGAILGLKILLHIAKIGTFFCYRSKSGNWELVWGHVARGGAGRWELPHRPGDA